MVRVRIRSDNVVVLVVRQPTRGGTSFSVCYTSSHDVFSIFWSTKLF